jgi:hypothetical protein
MYIAGEALLYSPRIWLAGPYELELAEAIVNELTTFKLRNEAEQQQRYYLNPHFGTAAAESMAKGEKVAILAEVARLRSGGRGETWDDVARPFLAVVDSLTSAWATLLRSQQSSDGKARAMAEGSWPNETRQPERPAPIAKARSTPGIRPAWMISSIGDRPSSLSTEYRSSSTHQLRRLRGLVNLYHWALEWTVHAATDWTLGCGAYPFRLEQNDLWLLDIETVIDFRSTCWRETALSVGATKRDNDNARGHFNPQLLQFDDAGIEELSAPTEEDAARRYTVKAHSQAGSENGLIFDGRDWVTDVLFWHPECDHQGMPDSRVRIPFEVISPALRQSSNRTEALFKKYEIEWDSAPFYLHFENGCELLAHLEKKRIDGSEAIADLDQHRRNCVARIERALREAYETAGARTSLDEAAESAAAAVTPSLQRAHQLAFLSFQFAEEQIGKCPKDADAYDWLKVHGFDVERSERFGPLADYNLPSRDTWITYARKGRSAAGENKNSPRAGRSGRSTVRQQEL